MHFGKFLLYTTIGAGAWNCILAALGWYLHSIVPEDRLNDTILEYGEYIKYGIIVIVGLALLYFIIRKMLKKQSGSKAEEQN